MTRRSYKIIKTTPMAPAGCHTHRHASRDSYYKNMISYITIYHSSFITTSAISHHMTIATKTSQTSSNCCCIFYVVAIGF